MVILERILKKQCLLMHWLWKWEDNIKADLKEAVFVNALAVEMRG
jgi:hypothetical protein